MLLVFAVDVVGYLLQHEATILLPQGKPHGSPFQSSGNKGPAHVAACDDGRRKIRRGGNFTIEKTKRRSHRSLFR